MAQKSIKSFFSGNTKSPKCLDLHCTSSVSDSIDDIKPVPKRKRLIVESDDSSGESPVKGSINPKVSLTDVNDQFFQAHENKGIEGSKGKHTSQTSPRKLLDSSENGFADIDEKVSPERMEDKCNRIHNSKSPKSPLKPVKNIITKAGLSFEKKSIAADSQSYDPSKPLYHPISDCNWGKGHSVPYLSLAKTFEYIESTSARLKIIDVLSNFFRSVGILSPTDFTICIYLCLNRLGPAYEGSELGVGETILLKALGATTGVSLDHLKTSLKRQGDLGAVAESIRSRQRTMFTPKPLTVSVVFSTLKEIAAMTGNASQGKKIDKIRSLLVACRECEAKYLIRSLSGKLRIGLAEQSVLAAIGQAAALSPFHSIAAVHGDASHLLDAKSELSTEQWKIRLDSSIANVKKAFCVCPDYDRLIKGLLADGPDGLHLHCMITPGIPLKPMLAHPTHGVTDVLKRFDEADFTCEYKYDGERSQIHVISSTEAHMYSRNQEDFTLKYPDVIKNVIPRVLEQSQITPHAAKLLNEISESKLDDHSQLESCIIDSEVVAWDRQAGQILPFQILSTRKRKDVDESNLKVQVCVYAFDLLYINGISLIEQPLRRRREILREIFPRIPGEFMMATSLDSSDTDEIGLFLEEAVKGNCEGLMVKTLDRNSTYEIAKRSHSWLKLKKDYLDGVGDTLDLVVIGGFHGTGKRAGRYGGFLLACYDADAEEYQTICKIGTGMKDEDLASFSTFFKDCVIDGPRAYYQYTNSLAPDHWFEPVQVWEIKAADLSISPAHKAAAGLADPQKGISLRFPRFIRIRDDKKPEDATTARQVYDLYKSQEQIKNQDKTAGPEDEDDLY